MSKQSPPGERIAKVLARRGVGSRRDVERMIEAGRVAVDGKTLTSPALNITGTENITVDNALVAEQEPPRVWRYHKPPGLVTTASDEKGRETIFDALPDDLPRVMSIGRLDIASEGLLLLTNDGALKRKLELPSTGWLRKYRVRIKGEPKEDSFEVLRRGHTVDGMKYQPMEIKFDRQQGQNAWLTVGLREGKNREIRRAMESLGFPVNRLIRISYGPFRLGDIKRGDVLEIPAKVLRDQVGLEPISEQPQAKARRKPSVRRRKR